MKKRAILATLLAAISFSTYAADFLVVVPVKGKKFNVSAIQVALAQTSLPGAMVGSAYSYNFSQNLQVTGDPAYSGFGVKWSVASGTLPAGLVLNSSTGVVSGTPTAQGTSSFVLAVAYKTKTGTQSYQIPVSLAAADPYWASTILAINAENGLTDVSGHTAMTVMGGAAASPTQKKFGNYSLSVGGGANYLTLPAMFMVETLSAPAWTIEFFFNTTHTVGEQFILSQGSYGSNHQFGLLMDSGTSFLVVSGSSGNWRVNSPTLSAGTWYHVALVMDKGVNSLYLNGVLLGSTPKTFPLSSVNPVTLGTSTFNNPAYAPFSGYIDDLRVTKAARYTSSFTAPAETFPTR